jgi:hypothetical protein
MIDHPPNVPQANTTDGKSLNVLEGMVKVLSDPTRTGWLAEIMRKNPVRINMDPEDPSVAVRTNANGTVERGHLAEDGQFVPASGSRVSDDFMHKSEKLPVQERDTLKGL